ncbi:MAG: bifunctional riboflavin kinase/FAD synthetase [Gammaproteobacteria bacterium]|nr:bifunctional riboflavin kinase/FAD synthetase [Gammaproteobacteria bacterium]
MRFIRKLTNESLPHDGCIASIGNFDGMHLGHRDVLLRLKEKAVSMQLPSVVIIFEPQPMEFFLGDRSNPRLMTLREKLVYLQKIAIDYVVCLRFNAWLSNLAATDFISGILFAKLKTRYMVVGDDCAFGCNRAGGFELLQQYLPVEKVVTVMQDNSKVSSTHIRQALAAGDLEKVATLLGRPYSMSGDVAHGEGLGHKLGFPTANIYLRHGVLALRGVFVARVIGLGAKPLLAVVNVGTRPTLNGKRNVLEAHILNFNQDVYGAKIKVEFIKKIRGEQKFASLELLKQQIAKDIHGIDKDYLEAIMRV